MINYGSLLKLSTVRRYDKDMVISREGASAKEEMLILLHGSAGVYKNYQTPSETLLDTLTPGGIVGEMSLFLGKKPDETVVALNDTIVVAINKQNAHEIFSSQPELTFNIFENICKKVDRLIETHQNLVTDVRAGVATKKLMKAENAPSKRSTIFPEGHGSYILPIDNSLDEYVYEQAVTCPICKHSFKNLAIITSKLRRESAEGDLRIRYKDIEPMYYDITSCPNCLFSVPFDSFTSVSKKFGNRIIEELAHLKPEVAIKTGYERDSFTVFAGYYLALVCVPICIDDYQMVLASLWMKLSRIYSDLQDTAMYRYASEQSLKEYLYSYQHFNLSDRHMQHICIIIGDLYQRLDDLEQARTFFYYAKLNRGGTSILKRQADSRLEELKAIIKERESALPK